MKEVGKIIEFDSEGRAVVEFEAREHACAGCASRQLCTQSGDKRRMVIEVIPGVAPGSRVYVEVGRPSLLQLPILAYVMLGSFLGGVALGELLFHLVKARQPGVLSLMLGLMATAVCIVALNVDEHRRSKNGFSPYIVGVMWRSAK